MSLRAEVVAAGREMLRLGLVAGTSGNVSAREGDRVHITPSGLPYGEMEEDDVVTLSLDGAVLGGTREPSSERRVHLAVYAARPDAGALVHSHSVHATAWSFLGEPLDTGTEELEHAAGGAVLTAPFAPTGSDEIAAAAVEALGGPPRGAARTPRRAGAGGVAGPGARRVRGRGAPGPDRAAAAVSESARTRPSHVLAAVPDALREARRPLCLGIGGGGDVVGALATAEHCRIEYGARPVLGGVTWERRPDRPGAGPAGGAEIANARPLAAEADPRAAVADPGAAARPAASSPRAPTPGCAEAASASPSRGWRSCSARRPCSST